MPRVPVMQAIVEILASEGVDTAFGCPGAAILPLYQALEAHGGIKHLVVRHEEGATHMADGWARTTGNVGVAIGTSGPAGTNTAASAGPARRCACVWWWRRCVVR